MSAVLQWAGDEDGSPARAFTRPSKHSLRLRSLPPAVEAALWSGTELCAPVSAVVSSGFAALDAELPGGGWPCRSLTEVLSPQPSVLEWRLIGPALGRLVGKGGQVVVIGHDKRDTLQAIREILPELEEAGIQLVYARDIVR